MELKSNTMMNNNEELEIIDPPKINLWGNDIYRYHIMADTMGRKCMNYKRYGGGLNMYYVSRKNPSIIVKEILSRYRPQYRSFCFNCNGVIVFKKIFKD